MDAQNEVGIPVCVISNPQEFSFLCPIERNLQMRNQCKPITNSGGSNETDLQEGSCDWSTLIAHSGNSAPWIGKHILAEWNRWNEAMTNHKRFANSTLCQFRIMKSHLYNRMQEE